MKDIFSDPIEKPREGVGYIEAFVPSCHSTARSSSTAVFHTPKYFIQANEEYQDNPWCGISICEIRPVKVPARQKGYKYRAISQDNFEDYYTRNYWRLQKAYVEEGEYYVNGSSGGYTLFGCREKEYMEIRVIYDITTLEVSLSRERKPNNYRYEVLRARPIPESVFKQAYLLTLEFLYDAEVALREWSSYWEHIRCLIDGDTPVKGLTVNAAAYFDEMEKTILGRKRRIEKQLIETDGTPEDRVGLRGELKGLDYCLKVIRANR